MTTRRATSATLALAIASLAPACSAPDNDRLSLGTPADPLFTPPAIEAGDPMTTADAPSLRGIDRSHWRAIDFIVPNDATVHHPHLATPGPRLDHATARARAEYPTPASALEQGGGTGMIVLEAVAAPLWAACDAVLAIPRALFPRRDSPMTAYARAPAPDDDAR